MEYEKILSQRAVELKPSGIRKFFDIANQMEDVISLGVGEPDFKTPWSIRHAGMESLEKGKTWYTANAGLAPLKQEIANYLSRRFQLDYDPQKEIIVTVGGSEGIDACIRALVDPGDEVLLPEPCFVAYAPITTLTGGVVVPLPCRAEDGFRLTPEALKAKITPKTKLLVLPFPNNPTGAVMRREHLEAIAEVLRGTDIMVLSDEIYAELTYGEERHVSIAEIPGMRERTIVINGFSKAYAMTGWRLGYAAGPAPVIVQMLKIHQFAIMCAPTTSQYAAIEALKNCDEEIEKMQLQYDMRRRLLVDSLNKMGLTCFAPEGAFYVFPSIRVTGLTSEEFCERLLYSQRVAVVPGQSFGESGEGFVRISYSYSIDHIMEALRRMGRFLKELGL
ncbi:MAG: aminotransferase class I/II-fold pyridoxal phosphate-dependent enzyme [Oscillospiraceae bacterium]|nr:aminotransferase class I/II-fold pyridoxal phosphate-dependent enzyme [Oscillospiraceae bacterium]